MNTKGIFLFSYFCFIVFTSGSLLAQDAFRPDTLFFNFRKISDERTPHDLKNGFTDCVQDHTGFIWFGSRNGLFRYDGVNYKAFKEIPGDSNSIGGEWVQALRVDLNGNIWIGGDGWLSRLDPHTEKIKTWMQEWKEPGGSGNGWHQHFVCDNQDPDILWFPLNSVETLFGRFDVSENKFTLIPLPEKDKGLRGYPVRYLSLVQDSNGVLYQGRIGSMAVYNPKAGEQWIYYARERGRHFGLLIPKASGISCLLHDSVYQIHAGQVTASWNGRYQYNWTYDWASGFSPHEYLLMENSNGPMIYNERKHLFSLLSD